MGNRGINVPDDPNCIEQNYLDSTVREFFTLEAERDDRFSQLVALHRRPTRLFAHLTKGGNRDVYGLYWIEPRGEELNAVRAGS